MNKLEPLLPISETALENLKKYKTTRGWADKNSHLDRSEEKMITCKGMFQKSITWKTTLISFKNRSTAMYKNSGWSIFEKNRFIGSIFETHILTWSIVDWMDRSARSDSRIELNGRKLMSVKFES